MVFFNVFFRTLGFLSALLIFLVIINILLHFSNNQKNQFVMTDGNESSNNIIANINLNGPIFNDNKNVLRSNFYDYINPEQVKSYLEELKQIKIKVLLININSPGGTVSATAELEKILYEFKKETNTKVYFYTNEILASGGYWVATVADKIFASYGSIIGSIGVSGPSWFYYNKPISLSAGVLGQSIETKDGIEVFNHNAGESKDLFNPYRRPKTDEIKHLQSIVDEVYNDFITKVSKSRKIEISNIKNNIGALIYSSNQAKNNFLIDDILSYETVINLIVKENKFADYKVYENKINNSFIGNLLVKFEDQTNNKYSLENICRDLETNISVVVPVYLKDC
ncbi:S49 family peptidase [Pelagibacteraceae bacterium]|nr:S49 family peptidase [Pelagibacteraceae bacterium]